MRLPLLSTYDNRSTANNADILQSVRKVRLLCSYFRGLRKF